MESVLVESTITKLSLAVSLIDDYTDSQPIGVIKLALGEKEAIRNRSGYYLFLDLAAGDYPLKVQARYYFDQEVDITLPLSGEPLANLTLKLNPSYPFSQRATLIRGMVRDTEGEPVPGATVKIMGKEIENKTTQKGEFVLYFKALKERDIIKVHKKRYVRRDRSSRLRLMATHPDYKTKTVPIEVEEGKTTAVSITLKKKGG